MNNQSKRLTVLIGVPVTLIVVALAIPELAQPPAPEVALPPVPPPSLSTVEVPPVDGIQNIVVGRNAAIALGKALFWDTSVGSDGQACASCHFHAGADSRAKNQLNPDLLNENVSLAGTFDPTASGDSGGPNYTLKLSDFPFHQFADPNDRNSGVVFTTNDVASSQGTFAGAFVSADPSRRIKLRDRFVDQCNRGADPIFNVGGIGVRKVESRNTPTVINAALNFRNFWDGRANNRFNGLNPFGDRDVNARILIRQANGSVVPVRISLPNSSGASQAVGPVLSDFESSCAGRTFAQVGRKLLSRRPLATQRVDVTDSVLGPYTDPSFVRGLKGIYAGFVHKAFNRNLWSGGVVKNPPPPPAGHTYPIKMTQMEYNFSLFFGLAVQLYESTLISDMAPYDSFAEGQRALSPEEQLGLDIFLNKGRCINCHKGPEFTGAATTLQAANAEGGLVERMIMNDGGVALYDDAFYNIGVTPTNDDLSLGRTDPFGNPLSFTVQFAQEHKIDPFEVNPCTFEIPFNPADCTILPSPEELANERVAVKGAFKVPTLRNVELTGPYFHNGSAATLEQVVEFYNRGGNFSNPDQDPDIAPIGLTEEEKANLVAFLKTLTDPRVANEQAPFDHPQLRVFNGHLIDHTVVSEDPRTPGLGEDSVFTIRAVGADGLPAAGLPPLQPFHEQLAP